MQPAADSTRMYLRLRTLHRLGLLTPILKLHRRIEGR